MFYKHKIREQNIEKLERELAEKKSEAKYLSIQNDSIRVANHKVTHRLSALEHSVIKLAEKIQDDNSSLEMSEELSILLDEIKKSSGSYQKDLRKINNKKHIPSTKINMLDNLFELFLDRCISYTIDFNLKVNGSIPYIIEHIISQSKLETMVGDHIQDAIIAINASSRSYKSILVILGLVGSFYELTIYDSGIPFEINTLVKLGTERITTHADIGGSGIGFMTTFETMRECGASLIINEKEPSDSDYTKSVTIRFDGKNQYIIETYRPDAFPTYSDRYIVKNNILLNT